MKNDFYFIVIFNNYRWHANYQSIQSTDIRIVSYTILCFVGLGSILIIKMIL